jgi:FAD binding domain
MTTTTIDIAGLEGGQVTLTPEALGDLDSRLTGRLLRPGDQGWDDAVRVWNALAAKVPALIVQPASANDVAAAVGFARDHGLLLSIKGGGHNIAGTALADGGLTLDMSRLRGIVVDPAARTATVQAGCLLGEVDRETQRHGLATPLGFISEVGVAGLTLGGGLGYLTRRFGWTVDNLLEVEVVTADGRVRRASRDQEPELFWGIRGAGANLGVVTRFTYRLHPVGPSVYGGLIAWPFERAEEVMAAYRTITSRAPRELTVFLVLLKAPPAPFVPPAWQGRRIVAMAVCYSGDLDRADQVAAPIRALADPVFDLLGSCPTPRCSPTSTPPSPEATTTTGRPNTSPSSTTACCRPPARCSPSVPCRTARWASSSSTGPSTSTTPTTGPWGTGTPASPSASRAGGRRTGPTPTPTGS